MLNTVKRMVPAPLKRRIKSYLANRHKPRLFGELAQLVPNVEQMFDGPDTLVEFKNNGEEFFRIYTERCGLKPDEKMLDVGSGIGRKTLPLVRYFNTDAMYRGFDITAAGIEWCRARYTPRYPQFQFQQIDVYNKYYNPGGKHPASEYKFPFADGSFSFVMLGSVFTHMLPPGVENYLAEISRVLAKGGRCLITYFLLNDEALKLVAAGKSSQNFKFVYDRYRTISEEPPEAATALDEAFIRALYARCGLKIAWTEYGSWCGRADFFSYQDLIFAVKE